MHVSTVFLLVKIHPSLVKKISKDYDSDNDDKDYIRNDEGAAVFSSSWLPGTDSKAKTPVEVNNKRKKRKTEQQEEAAAMDEDVVEDLVLGSDEEGSFSDTDFEGEESLPPKQQIKKQKSSIDESKNTKSRGKKLRIRKRVS